MQYLDEPNLAQVLVDIPENKIVNLISQIADAAYYLETLQISHRDIKPENILFRNSKENGIGLADFGLATSNDVEKYIFPRCGTPGYVAPEVTELLDNNGHYDLKCDLYSFGVTLLYVLTGQLPFPTKKEKNEISKDFKKLESYFKLSKLGIFF